MLGRGCRGREENGVGYARRWCGDGLGTGAEVGMVCACLRRVHAFYLSDLFSAQSNNGPWTPLHDSSRVLEVLCGVERNLENKPDSGSFKMQVGHCRYPSGGSGCDRLILEILPQLCYTVRCQVVDPSRSEACWNSLVLSCEGDRHLVNKNTLLRVQIKSKLCPPDSLPQA